MTDTPVEASEQQPQPENPASVLAARRVQQELSLESVASSLKLSRRMLQTLENGDFDSLPGDTFTRGYIRSYARLLGLDANRLAMDYDRLRGIETRERQVSGISRVTPASGNRVLFKISTLAVILAILLSLFFWWREHQPTNLSERMGYPQDSLLQDNEEIAVDALDLPEPLQANGGHVDSEVLEANESSPSGDPATEAAVPVEVPAEPETDDAGSAQAPVAIDQSAVAGTGNRLQLSFSSDCWVQVSSLSGQVLHSELMRAGQSLDLQHDSAMALVLGAAEAVATARFNGENIQLTQSGQPSGVARIRLGE